MDDDIDESSWEAVAIEQDIIMPLVGAKTGSSVYVFQTNRMWSQVKTAGSAIYANRHYLSLYKKRQPSRLASKNVKSDDKENAGPRLIGDVYIHPTAQIHPTCVVSGLLELLEHIVLYF